MTFLRKRLGQIGLLYLANPPSMSTYQSIYSNLALFSTTADIWLFDMADDIHSD